MPVLLPTSENIECAANALKNGALVAFPTETVYGLGANAFDSKAVAHIFEMKGRPRFNPLIVHVSHQEKAKDFAMFDTCAKSLATKFWPGPLTLVLPMRPDSGLSDLVTAGLDKVALRVPSHPVAQNLLHATTFPIAAPSANRSGHISPTMAAHVQKDFASEELIILDGGATHLGLESTIIGLSEEGPILLRFGSVTRKDIEHVIGQPLRLEHGDRIKPHAPGQLKSHYAPNAKLRLNATTIVPGEALLAFGPNVPEGAACVINLSIAGDVKEAAINLFASLRELDQSSAKIIAVMPIPDEGLGEAINDRLRRAAAPRD